MKKTLLFISIICFAKICFGQYQINPNSRTASILIQINSKGNQYSGSGFYLNKDSSVYLVTASHVLFNLETKLPNSDTVLFISYKNDVETGRKDSFIVSINGAIKSNKIKLDFINDVVVIKIADRIYPDSLGNGILKYCPFVNRISSFGTIIPWRISESSLFNKVESGSDLYIIGYPRSLGLKGKFDLDRPLIRKGIVAGKDYKLQRIIGDGAVYFGNSGGMVLAMYFNEKHTFDLNLIGLVSEYIPYDDILFDQKGTPRSIDHKNSGYSVIIPVDFIIHLINALN